MPSVWDPALPTNGAGTITGPPATAPNAPRRRQARRPRHSPSEAIRNRRHRSRLPDPQTTFDGGSALNEASLQDRPFTSLRLPSGTFGRASRAAGGSRRRGRRAPCTQSWPSLPSMRRPRSSCQ